ncbi:MAG: fluoride efflux transporter CrcB [Caldimicrobium sp.]
MLWAIFLVGVGGAFGSIFRFLISFFMVKYVSSSFPCGTLMVNLIGSFFITFLSEIFISTSIDPNYRYLLIIGFLGGFTTLSSVTLDTFTLFKNGYLFLAFLNMMFNSILTLFSGFLGFVLAKFLLFRGV